MRRYDKYWCAKWSLAGLCLLCYLLNACHKGRIEPLSHDEEVTLIFSAKLPSIPQGLKTYALNEDDENLLSDVDVLVFTDDGSDMKFRYRTPGKIISQSSGAGEAYIKVRLWRTDADSRLVIIANARAAVNAFDFDIGITTQETVQSELVYALGTGDKWHVTKDGGSDDFAPLPMWANYDVESGINGNINIGSGEISLMRSLARVDVIVADNVDEFELTEVWVFNSKANGLIIPNPNNLVDGVAQNPSLPSGGPVNNNDPLEYVTDGGNSIREIYLFEAAAQPINDGNATALVIGGKYHTDTDPTYYRIDFRNPLNSNNPYPILRNHRYQITITGALDAGYENHVTAFESDDSVEPVSYKGFTGLYPAQPANQRPSVKRTDIIPKSNGGISYTVTAITENQ